MLARLSEALVRRRLGGAVLVLAGIGIAAVVLLSGSDSDEGQGGRGRVSDAARKVRLVSVPPLGFAFAHPTNWRRTVAGRVIRLRAPDGTAVMTFASPAAGDREVALAGEVERVLAQQLAPARVVRRAAARLGGHSGRSIELVGGRETARVRALAVVAASGFRTYAVTLITPERPSRRRLAQADAILATVAFSRPATSPTGTTGRRGAGPTGPTGAS